MLIPQDTKDFRLTDDIERQLIQQAIEEQFRPHPFRAIGAWLGKLAHSFKVRAHDSNTGNTAAHA